MRPLIEQALGPLANVRVTLFEPVEAPEAKTMRPRPTTQAEATSDWEHIRIAQDRLAEQHWLAEPVNAAQSR